MHPTKTDSSYGPASLDRRDQSSRHDLEGARAALETFYHAFHARSFELFDSLWADSPWIQLNNPLGGLDRGLESIRERYRGLFEGSVRVQVRFHDIVEYASADVVVFAGREEATVLEGSSTARREFRTTRAFTFEPASGGWKQFHHHGSLADAESLRRYQASISKSPTDSVLAGNVTVVAHATVQAAHVEDFLEATRNLVVASRKEPGASVFRLHRDPEAIGHFTFYEVFDDAIAAANHMTELHTKEWFGKVGAWLEGPPKLHRLESVIV